MPLPFQRRGGAQLRPSFSRDFAGLKTLDHGVGPAITFTRASNATFFDASGVLQTASNDAPRFDHSGGSSLGLLIEEARTNSIRNSQGGGSTNGVIGSGGVAPTNWVVGSAIAINGLTSEIVGTGTESGLAYVDFKVSGTPTANGDAIFAPEPLNHVSASSGQTWTGSFYSKLVGGGLTNVLSVNIFVQERAANIIKGTTTTAFTPTSASLNTQRNVVTRTLTDATSNTVGVTLQINYTSGNPIDLTLRIAAPQLEAGAFPTSYIPTTTAAATRSADSAVVTPISGFYNQSEGTLFAEGSSFGNEANATSVSFSTSDSSNERFQMRIRGGPMAVVAGGVTSFVATGSDPSANVVNRRCGAARANDFAISTNGGTVETDASGDMPSVTHLSIGRLTPVSTLQFANGHIRKIAYYPKRLTNTLLQQLTT